MDESSPGILIFTAHEAVVSAPVVRRGLGNAMERAAAQASEVAISTLQENLRRFLRSLDAVLSASPSEIGGLTLDEVTICAQIDAKGRVGISAVAGTELGAQSAIRLVLRRRA